MLTVKISQSHVGWIFLIDTNIKNLKNLPPYLIFIRHYLVWLIQNLLGINTEMLIEAGTYHKGRNSLSLTTNLNHHQQPNSERVIQQNISYILASEIRQIIYLTNINTCLSSYKKATSKLLFVYVDTKYFERVQFKLLNCLHVVDTFLFIFIICDHFVSFHSLSHLIRRSNIKK